MNQRYCVYTIELRTYLTVIQKYMACLCVHCINCNVEWNAILRKYMCDFVHMLNMNSI